MLPNTVSPSTSGKAVSVEVESRTTRLFGVKVKSSIPNNLGAVTRTVLKASSRDFRNDVAHVINRVFSP